MAICNECMNKPTTMDLVHHICRFCNKEFIEASIKEEEQWHKQYDSSLSSLINSINSFLNTNTTNSLYTLCTFLTNPDVFYIISDHGIRSSRMLSGSFL